MLFCEGAQKYLENRGVKTIGKEIWPIGALTDASPIMQKVKSTNPDLVIYGGSALSEIQLFIMKKKELDMKRTIFLASSGWMGDPNLRFGGEYLNSWIGFTPQYANKRTPKEWITRILDQCRKEYSDEPWIALELGYAMNLVPVYAEVLERAGSRDRKVITETTRKLDIHNVTVTGNFIKQGVAFDETGRIAKKYHGIMIIQWQNGKCIPVYPSEVASANPRLVF
jgi:branched-chain amino acid transport system substrate-binding protein